MRELDNAVNSSDDHPRARIGQSLSGDVLEVGPGSAPFPVGPGAHVRYADRSVPGGRDSNWPELIGTPWGPDAHFNVDLDASGLAPIASASFDAVVGCHVIEHLANPLRALTEFDRVLRPGGRLVLILPDRTLTFDRVRKPTPFKHLISELREDVTEVSDAHIVEFCKAIHMQPPMHPELVRDWHNPKRLDQQRMELHRRRSIHVHCWAPEEFAATLACMLAEHLVVWRLADLYFVEDEPSGGGIEFGLVLTKTGTSDSALALASNFIEDWTRATMRKPSLRATRLVRFGKALHRDLSYRKELRSAIAHPSRS
jgi:SAM-dependent methyltransferase